MLQALFQRPGEHNIADLFSVEHITIQYILSRQKFRITSRTILDEREIGSAKQNCIV